MSVLHSLSSKHGELLSDIAKLQRQKDFQSRQTMMEIVGMKRYKDKLGVEIKKMLTMLADLRGGKEAIESSLKDFSDETAVLMADAAKGVMRDYAEMRVKAKDEAGKVTEDRSKANNLSAFLYHKEKELDVLSVDLARKEDNFKRRDKLVSEAEMDLAMREVKITTQLRDAGVKYEDACSKLKEADSVLKQATENRHQRLKEASDRLQATLLREAKVKAREDVLLANEKKLRQLERLLKDRDMALNRKARELKLVI